MVQIIRLQTGMRHAWGKPMGTAARVKIGTVLMSVRTYDKHKNDVIEALRRTGFRFPGMFGVVHSACVFGEIPMEIDNVSKIVIDLIFEGKQKVLIGDTWGFTKFTREQYTWLKENNMLKKDGINALRFNARGKMNQAPKEMRMERHELRRIVKESGLFDRKGAY